MNNTVLDIIKFATAFLLVPFAWALSVAFHGSIDALPGAYDIFFFWGMFGFVMIYLFFFQFWGVYELGQMIMTQALKFMSPVHHFVARVIPFYFTVILILFWMMRRFTGTSNYDHYFMFFAGFAFTMHVVLTAQDLQDAEKAFVKPSYLFMIMAVMIFLICFAMLMLDLVLGEWTFPKQIVSASNSATEVYYAVFKRLAFWR